MEAVRALRRVETRERVAPYAAVAVALAVVGIIATVWRPLAPALPATPTVYEMFDGGVLEAVAEYRRPRRLALLATTAAAVAVPTALLLLRSGRRLVAAVAGPRAHAPLRAGLLAAVIAVLVDLTAFPLSTWVGFVHETEWGFRTSPLSGWLRDWLVGRGTGWLLSALGGVALVWAIARWPRSWHWRGVVIGAVAIAVLVLIRPLALEPLMLRTEPLPEGQLRERVATVLVRAGYDDVPILVGDASRRTTKANAYVTGLGPSRRVVLYDNLVALPPEQVVAVGAHEVAHDRNRDIERGVLLGVAGLAVALPLLRWAMGSGWARRAVGARGPSDPRLIVVAAVVVAVLTTVAQPVYSHVSRQMEAAADHGAFELSRDPQAHIRQRRTVVVRDLSDPAPPTWFMRVFATHPPSSERIRAAVAFAEREGIPLPSVHAFEADEQPLRHPRTR
jgi:STE24 endopeptidase